MICNMLPLNRYDRFFANFILQLSGHILYVFSSIITIDDKILNKHVINSGGITNFVMA